MKKFLVGILSVLMLVGIGVSPVKAEISYPINTTHDFITLDGGMQGNVWAVDTFHNNLVITQEGENTWRVVSTDEGTFESISGAKSPGGEEGTLIGDGTRGTISGGITVLIYADNLKTWGSQTEPEDLRGTWTNYFQRYYGRFFENIHVVDGDYYSGGTFENWDWTYTTCNNGKWVDNENTETLYQEEGPNETMGDITGAYVPCAQPVVVPQPLSQAGAPVCSAFSPAMIQHAIAKRINATNSVVSYWPTVTGGQVNIRYREEGAKDWQHALRDFPNLGVAPIGFLKENVKYEYQITNGHGCAQSNWSPVFRSL